MALKRAAAPVDTAETKAADAVKETVKDVETKAAAEVTPDTSNDVKDDAPAQGELVNDVKPEKEDAKPEVEPEVEAEAKTEAKPEAKPEAKEVAVKSENTGVVTNAERHASASEKFTQDMAAQGYEGLTVTGMSFDRLKLHEAKFQLGSEEISLGESLDLVVLNTRNIYVVRQYAGEGAEMFYSYHKDGSFFTDETSSKETLDKWLEDGYGTPDEPLDIKEYIEAMSQLKNRDDEYNDHVVSLSIPPASKARLSGAMVVGLRKFKCDPADLVIRCTVGKKVGTGDKAFRPWNFTAIGDQNAMAAAE